MFIILICETFLTKDTILWNPFIPSQMSVIMLLVGTYYHPQTKLREGNVFTPVYDSVHKGVSVQGGFLSRGSLSRGGSLSTGGLCLGGGVVQGVSVQGVSLQRGVSVQGFLCPEGGWVSVRGGLCQRDPLYGKERAVRILLECILVRILTCYSDLLEYLMSRNLALTYRQ